MATTLTLRTLTNPGDTTKGSPLTNAEVDQNFIDLDADIQTRATTEQATNNAIAFAIALG